MGPGGHRDRCRDGSDTGLVEQGRGWCFLHEGVHSGSVLGEIVVEGSHSLGEADRFSPGCSGGDGFVADSPPCDLGDPSAGQRSTSVDAEVDDPQEPGQSVEGGGAFGSHVLAGGDEDAQGGAFAVIIARAPQARRLQGQRGCCDSAGIEGVGLADSAVRARVHPGCFGDLVAGLGGCLRKLSTVGADSLDDPQDVQVRAGAPRGPVERALKTRVSGRELGRVDQFSQRCGEDRQSMRLRVGVDADDKGMGMRDDSQGDRGSFLGSGNRDRSLRPAPDREGVTPGQLCDGPRPHRIGQSSDQVAECAGTAPATRSTWTCPQ